MEKPELSINLHDESDNEQVSIIIVHNNKPKYLSLLLQSVDIFSFNNNYEIIVVDNGSDQESQDFLNVIEGDVKVIRNKENLYWTTAVKQGVAAADKDSKYFVFLHHDVVVLHPDWLKLLLTVSKTQNSGMVGTELQEYFMRADQPVKFIREWCFLMSKKCYEEIDPFPDTLKQVGTTFITTMRAQKKGFNPQIIKNSICHHFGVFSLNINEWERLTESARFEIPKLMKKIQEEN